ncbi:MAG: hypothetical protein ABID54_09885 [Pseudomonadota bacterium]
MSETREITILMVDKQVLKLAEPLAEFLDMSGEECAYTVTSCDNYTEALSMLDGVDVALVELDLTKEYSMAADADCLPWIKEDNAGYRFLVYLKQEYPSIKVIMLVDYPACEDPGPEMSDICSKGAEGYVVKPFVVTKLIEEIHRFSVAAP